MKKLLLATAILATSFGAAATPSMNHNINLTDEGEKAILSFTSDVIPSICGFEITKGEAKLGLRKFEDAAKFKVYNNNPANKSGHSLEPVFNMVPMWANTTGPLEVYYTNGNINGYDETDLFKYSVEGTLNADGVHDANIEYTDFKVYSGHQVKLKAKVTVPDVEMEAGDTVTMQVELRQNCF